MQARNRITQFSYRQNIHILTIEALRRPLMHTRISSFHLKTTTLHILHHYFFPSRVTAATRTTRLCDAATEEGEANILSFTKSKNGI